MKLAILTPFEGKGWALDRWLAAVRAAALPEGTEFLWLCNSADEAFSLRLDEAAATMPWPVVAWRDTERIIEATAMIAKDSTVARLWREMRGRLPADVTHVLCLEDDVIVGPTTITDLLALCSDETTAVGSPVPEYVPTNLYMAWLHIGDPATGQCAPVGSAPAEVHALSFGCTLFPRGLFDALTLKPGKDRRPPFWGYDNCAGEEVGLLGGKVIAAWNLPVEHLPRPGVAMPASPAPPAPMLFSTPEREWLRLAAMADPDWSTLQRIARTALDYGQLRRLAGLHQLAGVVAWRLCDPRMDGVAPNIVRDACQQHLEQLAKQAGGWWRDSVALVVRALEDAGIIWVTNSGPVQYLPLGLPHFPRAWSDFDVFMPAEYHYEARRALEAAGFVFQDLMCQTLNPVYTSPTGLDTVEIIGLPPEHAELPLWAWHHRPEFYRGRVLREVNGLSIWTPAPEWMVSLMAYRTYISYCRQAAPLPLWGLARLWAWRHHIGDAWNEAEFVRAIHLAMEVGWPETAHLPNVTWGRGILFSLEVASRVYGLMVPEEFAALLEEPFYFLISEPGPGRHGVTKEIAKLDEWPSDEEVIFDLGYSRSLREKIARGHWRRME